MEMEGWSHTVTIVSVYGPTDDSNVNIDDQFMRELTRTLRKISNRKKGSE